jgi:5'-nucleotidase
MRLLVTNDDGYLALGLRTLASAAEALGTVDVVAPDREQSATSHSLTLHHPLRARVAQSGIHVVDGTPTDCVVLAAGELLEQRPDVVLSGINHGANMGDDVLYSGTVAAAMEATILGIPSIAFSYAGSDYERIESWRDVVARLLERILQRGEFPAETLLNVNLPPIHPDELKGVRVTTLGRREYVDSLRRGVDPNGREYFWIGGGSSRWWGRDDSDFRAVESGHISVTPLHLDLTNHALMRDIGSWELEL